MSKSSLSVEHNQGFREEFRLQLRVIAALMLRETRATYGTSQLGYAWAVLTPVVGVAIMVVLFTGIGRLPPFGTSLALFFATGILTLGFFQKLSSSLMTVFEANKALLTYPLIRGSDVLFSRSLLVAATHAVIMLMFFSSLIFLNLAELPAYPEEIAAAFLATFLLGFGFGTISAIIVILWESWKHINRLILRPLFFLSAIFYIPSYMPPNIIAWLRWNPVLHCVEWMRNGYYANYDSRVLDAFYLLSVGVALTFVSLLGERLIRKRIGAP